MPKQFVIAHATINLKKRQLSGDADSHTEHVNTSTGSLRPQEQLPHLHTAALSAWHHKHERKREAMEHQQTSSHCRKNRTLPL